MDLEVNIKFKRPLLTALVILSGKEYVGIVRLHNAIESEAQLARVSLMCSYPRWHLACRVLGTGGR